jgi:hypothetical protein
MAVLGALVGFGYLVAGFANRQLVERVGALLQEPYSCRQATYDLRRLKRKGLIEKIAQANRYRLTSLGRRVAVLFTKAYGRVLAPGLSALDPQLPADLIERSDLSRSWRCFSSSRRLHPATDSRGVKRKSDQRRTITSTEKTPTGFTVRLNLGSQPGRARTASAEHAEL